ncbi:MAG: hypothetical protein JNL32_16150, partial [Candidatus Kapabacteria bacterium]|nr:hypothetical protein [Candidatus Kapabacteria bacterium]
RQTTTRTQGAFLISILLALVALTHTALAVKQDSNLLKIPKITLLYKVAYGGGVYIANFDTANRGHNAVIGEDKYINYLRYVNDTVNQYKEGYPKYGGGLRAVDLDGDGIKELIDAVGSVYQTKKIGVPYSDTKYVIPNPNSVSSTIATIRDIDGDGNEDVMYEAGINRYAVLWGRDTIQQVKLCPVIHPPNIVTADGFPIIRESIKVERIGVFAVNGKSYFMYTSWAELSRNGTYGVVYVCSMKREDDTLRMSVIDSVYGFRYTPMKPIIGGSLYYNPDNGKTYWLTKEVIGYANHNDISRNYTFEMQEDGSWLDVGTLPDKPVRVLIRRLGEPDTFHWQKSLIIDSTANPPIAANFLFSEYPRDGVQPYCRTFGDFPQSIYDVDGDGISDWYAGGSVGKGFDWRKPVSVEYETTNDVLQLSPNQTNPSGRILLHYPNSADTPITVHLYGSDGRMIGVLYKGEQQQSGIPLNLGVLSPPAGRYIVKVTAGAMSASAPLLIIP